MSNNDFIINVTRFISDNDLIKRGSKVCACLSGGADSVAMLCALNELGARFQFNLSAIHINHMIRGAEADRDMEFCRALCGRLNIVFTAVCVDVPALCKTSGKSLEETARDARYTAFEKHAADNSIDYFATAHTASDNAETVLMNLVRGTTVAGLSGIPVKRDMYIRPLLSVYRSDVESFLQSIDQEYVIDSTNLINDCTRNIIRNEVLPLLRRINHNTDIAINRLSSNAADIDRLVVSSFENVDDLTSIPRAAAIRLVKHRFMNFCGKGMLSHHAETIVDSLHKDTVITLQGGIYAVLKNGRVRFEHLQEKPRHIDTAIYKLQYGINYFDGGKVLIYYGDTPQKNCDYFTSIDSRQICGNVYYRARMSGDEIKALGVNRSVKKAFINKKIPARLRDAIPVFFDDEGIVCVPFIGAADRIYSHREDADYISVTFLERQDMQ